MPLFHSGGTRPSAKNSASSNIPRHKTRPNDENQRTTNEHHKPLSCPKETLLQEERSHNVQKTPKKARNELKSDEQSMMDDLLAGLDASVFEWGRTPSQGSQSRSTRPSQHSPLKGKKRRPQNISLEEQMPPAKKAKPLSPKKVVAFGNPDLKPFRIIPKSPTKPITGKERNISSAFRSTTVKQGTIDSPTNVEQIIPLVQVKRESSPLEAKSDEIVEMDIKPVLEPTEALDGVKKESPDIDDDDMFEFDFNVDDLAVTDEDLSATVPPPKIKYPILHPAVPPAAQGYAPTPWARCTVEAVFGGLLFEDGVIPSTSELERIEVVEVSFAKSLIITLTEGGARGVVHLKDRWADTEVRKGDIINIISPLLATQTTKPISVTFKDPSTFLIHHPDLMITMTSIANAMPCPRKPIIQSLIRTPGPPTKPLLYGNLLHSLLQGALLQQDFDAGGTFRRLDAELKKDEIKLDIWSTDMGILDVREEVGVKAGRGFEVFGERYITKDPKPEGELHSSAGDQPALLAINGLHEVEEEIWSPKWGLKGKVDASVQAKIIRDPLHGSQAEEHVAPFEIKTGRSVGVMAHRAQTMLYTLLMEDRYGVPVPAGLLYYSALDTILRVEAKQNEIRALIMARNELAMYISKQRKVPKHLPEGNRPVEILRKSVVKKEMLKEEKREEKLETEVEEAFLPPTIDNMRDCKMCYAVESCMLYRKVIDKVPQDPEDPIAQLYEEHTGHMTEKDAEFYKKWDTLLTVEEQDTVKFRSQLWTMTAKQREKNGRCFSDMIIESYSNDLGKSLAKIHRHSYTFIRAPSAISENTTSLLSGHIAKGDPVSLSIEPDLLCMWRGFVTDLTQTNVTVGVTYVINTDALLKRTGREHRVLKASDGQSRDKVVFRIDKDEMASGMMRMRNNLAQLFYKNGDGARRRLIVDQAAPEFEPSWRPEPSEIPPSLNSDQQKAMESVLTARDYSLILGMPGTGKTTTIAEIIKALVARGKSVLLTSYTHSAVDAILMKLADAEFGVLRLGNIDKVHPDVQHLTLEAYEASASMDQLNARLMTPPVVAATCLAIDHPLFFRRRFDYCIVDEASQITLPTCIGPLRMADKFVLVGDHYQLPPIVRHAEARRGGLDVSLFRHLSATHPSAVVDLSYQYRMNEDIMALSNKLVYEGRLKCGNEQVAQSGLKLRSRKRCKEIFGDAGCTCDQGKRCWIQDLLEESAKCVFIDTDRIPALDSRVGDLVQNETEAKLVQQLSTALIASGVRQEDIAIITPYRQQIKLLSSYLKPIPRVEILTADKSQGRDKDCILVSLVRSNESGNIGDLLRDWRRINVSFTRAKKKLVIFASAKTLNADPLFKEFLELVREKGFEKKLKKGDDKLHRVEVPNFQVPTQDKGKERVKIEKKERTIVAGAGKRILNGRGPFVKEVMVGERDR
ncbi:DNA replication ATP-dependent helicase Dna2 [Cryptococcus neoformans]|nr:DNA replication ATP-dependent helicase Dna2 [Cryptococcus neoformans var. grubii Th84]OXH09557.1 DNA replication ATP-dependent helicase Dna2 [Cryptococcus neoformans var. grubii]OXH30588.1 DNA replication ATP-dependent helicase Dna2 [Cryptococcus neoformans var. grubii]OXH50596.1 DNA replication ATP-dependent helicase Dna2 [Cryptococcus neoformans var. grubii]OXH51166.1 DNA replication ATP-dependent helicase Dna2 [Cryptococcus neoformans var. grubii]